MFLTNAQLMAPEYIESIGMEFLIAYKGVKLAHVS